MALFEPMLRAAQLTRFLARRAAFFLACAAVFIGSVEAGLREYPLRIETVRSPRQHELIAHNEGPVTMTVYLTISGTNVASDVAWPITKAIPAYTSVNLAKLFPEDATKKITSVYSVSRQYGDFRAVHSSEVHYRLPYMEGSAFRITQAYGDPLTSHVGHHSQHAIDFAMPENTPVVAARGGIVADVTLEYEAGGISLDLRDKANSVVIVHDDGTVAQYAHLAKRAGTTVKVGDRVKAGVVIGYSGNTGYSSGAHLHFAVTKPEVLADGRVAHVALPIKFYVDTWTLPFEPRRGALVTASYSGNLGAGAAQSASREPQGALSHEPASVSLIPVKAPASVQSNSALRAVPAGQSTSPGESAAPVQVANVTFEQSGVVRMQRVAPVPPAAAPVAPPATPIPEQRARAAMTVSNETTEWTVLELALAGLAGALVLLFAWYLRGQLAIARAGNLRAD